MKILQAFSKTLEKIRAGAADIGSELEKVRLDRLAILNELELVKGAPVTPDVIRARVAKVVDDSMVAVKWRYDLFTFGEPGYNEAKPVSLDAAIQQAPLGTLALLGFRETMIAALVEQSKTGDGEPITEAERTKRVTKLTAELRKVEIAEETLVRSLEEAGFAVHRRPDADPAVILADDLEQLAS